MTPKQMRTDLTEKMLSELSEPSEKYPWVRKAKNSSFVHGPIDRGCSEVICQLVCYNHYAEALNIAALLRAQQIDIENRFKLFRKAIAK